MTHQEKQNLYDKLSLINTASFSDLDDFREGIWQLTDAVEKILDAIETE